VPRGVGRLSAAATRPLAVLPRVAERIAALLDGRLDAGGRAATLDGLYRAGAALETLADSAAVVRELERARRADPARALHAWATRRRR
jgi:hypothetical protein